MRFVNDDGLSFCLTISTGIKRDDLLDILGKVEKLSVQWTFNDFAQEIYQPGKRGLLNVFDDDGDLVTLENNGFLGVAHRTVDKIAEINDVNHYVAIHHSSSDAACRYVEVQDGMIVANFDPLSDEAPEAVADFFPKGGNVRFGMIEAVNYRIMTMVRPEWLIEPADTYVVDYGAHH